MVLLSLWASEAHFNWARWRQVFAQDQPQIDRKTKCWVCVANNKTLQMNLTFAYPLNINFLCIKDVSVFHLPLSSSLHSSFFQIKGWIKVWRTATVHQYLATSYPVPTTFSLLGCSVGRSEPCRPPLHPCASSVVESLKLERPHAEWPPTFEPSKACCDMAEDLMTKKVGLRYRTCKYYFSNLCFLEFF